MSLGVVVVYLNHGDAVPAEVADGGSVSTPAQPKKDVGLDGGVPPQMHNDAGDAAAQSSGTKLGATVVEKGQPSPNTTDDDLERGLPRGKWKPPERKSETLILEKGFGQQGPLTLESILPKGSRGPTTEIFDKENEQTQKNVPTPAFPGLIVSPTSVEPFDDVVAVADARAFKCSGVLLSTRHVITAKHCLPATRIFVGHDITKKGTIVDISAAFVHPSVDVALLRLADGVVVRRHGTRQSHDKPSGSVRVVGFGTADPTGRKGYGLMRQGDAQVTGWGCDSSRARTFGCLEAAEMIVTSNEIDTCTGDSGGPLFERSEEGWRLIAITSRGLPARGRACGDGGIYVRVDTVRDWMTGLMGEGK